jgi:hypothetical protein
VNAFRINSGQIYTYTYTCGKLVNALRDFRARPTAFAYFSFVDSEYCKHENECLQVQSPDQENTT